MPVRAMEWIGASPWEGTADATNREGSDDSHIVLICGGPNFFDTLAKWKRHLAMLKTLPDNTMLKAEMIEDAEEVIAWKKGGPQPMPKGMPTGKWLGGLDPGPARAHEGRRGPRRGDGPGVTPQGSLVRTGPQ
jgi:hypothetical protein